MSDSLFFDYFKDKLRFLLFWKENPWWPVFKGIAKSLDQAREDIKWVREQYSPSTCDPKFIQYYGESRGIKQFPFEEPDQFSNRVNLAYQYWKSAGITSTIQEWLDRLGIAATTIEYKDKGDKDYLTHLDWAEVYVQFDSFHVDINQRRYVQLLIDDLKRASALILAGFRYQTLHETQVELPRHIWSRYKHLWQYSFLSMSKKLLTTKTHKPVVHVSMSLAPETPVFDDTETKDSRNYVRTFDSGWSFDLPEDRPVKIRKAI